MTIPAGGLRKSQLFARIDMNLQKNGRSRMFHAFIRWLTSSRRLDRLAAEIEKLETIRSAHLNHIERLETLVATQHQTTEAALRADLELSRSAHLKQIERFEALIARYQATEAALQADLELSRLAHLKRIEALEALFIQEQATEQARVDHVKRLETLIPQIEIQIAGFDTARIAAEDQAQRLTRQEADLTARSAELRLAQENQSAVILGKLSLIDYQLEATRRSGIPSKESGIAAETTCVAAIERYLDLLENSLTGRLTEDPPISPWSNGRFDSEVRLVGRDWPASAQTMIGSVRMRNIRHLVERVIAESVPGDLIETGVWRGGACIYMRAILAAYGIVDRKVWVADSFRGLPPPDPERFPADAGDMHHKVAELVVSAETVRANFARYGLLDRQVAFLEGWFKDTLPNAPIEQLALLRLDGDMYESTSEALDALYWKLSTGGYVIIDDYLLEPCRAAVDQFRSRHGITSVLETVDGAAVFWRKMPDELPHHGCTNGFAPDERAIA
jgi:O-methyltransferase/8-demethyl-8-(2,3-dimethoxy-alpha-L-rhamnosyl)tetracenomycin-C 4'-O-methyltransferase